MSNVKRFYLCFDKDNKRNLRPDSPGKSFIRLIPLTQLSCVAAGIFLCNPTRKWHMVWSLVTVLLRLWMAYCYASEEIKARGTIESINEVTFYSFTFVSYILLAKKKSSTVQFLSSEKLSPVDLRKVDLLCLLFYLGAVAMTTIPEVESPILFGLNKKKVFGSLLRSFPTVESIMCFLSLVIYNFWFQLAPLFSVIYALGYMVLYSCKLNALNFIETNLHQLDHRSLMLKLKQVKCKQKQFESIFGPFLLLVLGNNFLATMYFFLILKLMIADESGLYYNYCLYYIAYCVHIEIICIGLIFCIAHYNAKIKDLSDEVLGQIEAKSSGNLHLNFLLVKYLQEKINKSINDPLTACGMVNVDRQIVLGIAASCISFAVLLIQINNGALNS